MRTGTWILVACGVVGLAVNVGTAQDRFSFAAPPSDQNTSYTPRTGEEQPSDSDASRFPFATSTKRSTPATQSPGSPDVYGTRYPKPTTSTAPRVPNFHRELFGTDRPQQNPFANRAASKTESQPYNAKTKALPGFPRRSSYDVLRTDKIGQNRSRTPYTERSKNYQFGKQTSPYQTATYPKNFSDTRTRATAPQAPATSGQRRGRLLQADFKRPRNSQQRNYIRSVQETRPGKPVFDKPSERFEIRLPDPAARQERSFQPAQVRSLPPVSSGVGTNEKATPTGSSISKSPMVSIQWVKRGRIHVGRECAFDLKVRNNGKITAANVTVDAHFPTSVRLTKSDPEPMEAQDHLSWEFTSLDPGEEKTIQISLIPSKRGELATRAFVRYTGAAEGVFNVEEPLLQVAMKGPGEVLVGDPASQTIMVSNPGTGVATNVSVEAIIPVGLEHPRGERLVMEIGALNPGESRSVRLALAAALGGQHTIQVRASADDNLRRSTSSDINVIAPNIEVEIDGPALRYLGRKASYILDVSNDGDASSNNVRVTQYVPEGFDFIDADHGGNYDRTNRTINWFVGRLEMNQSVQLKCDLEPTKLGRFEQRVVAISEQGIKTEENYTTDVDGTASLILEIVDLDDPVEIGTETAYEIRVRNEGTKAGQSIDVTCDLPAGIELISAKGPTGALDRNGQIVFKTLPTLASGKTAIYRVHVRGKVEGNHRFRAHLSSESIQKPLTFEELTKFYTD